MVVSYFKARTFLQDRTIINNSHLLFQLSSKFMIYSWILHQPWWDSYISSFHILVQLDLLLNFLNDLSITF